MLQNNLIICPTCGNAISRNAKSCTHCGEPNKNNKMVKRDIYLILWFFLGIFGFHLAYAGYRKGYYAHLIAIIAGIVTPFIYLAVTNRYISIPIVIFYFSILILISFAEIMITKDSNGIPFQ